MLYIVLNITCYIIHEKLFTEEKCVVSSKAQNMQIYAIF